MTHLELATMIAEARQTCTVDAAQEALAALEAVVRARIPDGADLPPAASTEPEPPGKPAPVHSHKNKKPVRDDGDEPA